MLYSIYMPLSQTPPTLGQIDQMLAPFSAGLIHLYAEIIPYLRELCGAAREVQNKNDGSLVTEADRHVELKLRELCAKLLPDAKFLGEESVAIPDKRSLFDAPLVVIVDPVDGTKNFVAGTENWGSLVGVSYKSGAAQRFHFGMACIPLQDCAYYTRGTSVYCWDFSTGTEAKIVASPPPNKLKLAANHYHCGVSEYEPLRSLADYHTTDASIVDMLGTILGVSHASITQSKIWDIAGPAAIIERLGVSLYNPLTGVRKIEFTPDDFILTDSDEAWALKSPLIATNDSGMRQILAAIKAA